MTEISDFIETTAREAVPHISDDTSVWVREANGFQIVYQEILQKARCDVRRIWVAYDRRAADQKDEEDVTKTLYYLRDSSPEHDWEPRTPRLKPLQEAFSNPL